MSIINYQIFNRFSNITHFCTTRDGGVSIGNYSTFNISPFCGDKAESQNQNIKILSKILDIDPGNLIIPFQTHQTVVKNIDKTFIQFNQKERLDYLTGVDALITNLPEICIGVTTADCVPIMYFDVVNNVLAVAHAGWRGTCMKIAGKTIEKMMEDYGCNPKNIYAVIGPSISQRVYKVGEEVLRAFEHSDFPVENFFECIENEYYLDLWNANHWLLMKSGVPENQIEIAGMCTFTENEKFFSARRLGLQSGRMLSGIMLK